MEDISIVEPVNVENMIPLPFNVVPVSVEHEIVDVTVKLFACNEEMRPVLEVMVDPVSEEYVINCDPIDDTVMLDPFNVDPNVIKFANAFTVENVDAFDVEFITAVFARKFVA